MTHTIVLAESADAPALRRWLAARARVVDEVTRSHSELGCLRFALPDGTEIAVLEDHVDEVAYVTLAGASAAAWAQSIAQQVRTVTMAGALAMVGTGNDPRQWIRALSRLAVLRGDAPTPAPAMLRAWTTAFAHPHRAVRRAAIRTCYGSRWPELPALVLARIGLDPELRAPLEQLATHLERLNYPEERLTPRDLDALFEA